MTIKYPYAVKYKGVIYPANTEIEEVATEAPKVEETPETKKASKSKKAVKGEA